MAIDSTLPAWLARRSVFDNNSVSQSFLQGAQVAEQIQQNQRLNRAMQLQEEARQMAIEEKQRVAEGAVEITRILSDMGRTGGYSDPALQSKFWEAVSRNPKFAGSPAFKDIMDTFQYADQAKARSEVEALRQQNLNERSEQAIQSRFDLLSQRLDGMTQMEGLKQENRTALAELKAELDRLRDSMKPTRTGALIHDLPESELVAMRKELDALDNIFQKGGIKGSKRGMFQGGGFTETPAQEYQRLQQNIIRKYDAKRIGSPSPASAPSNDPLGLFK